MTREPLVTVTHDASGTTRGTLVLLHGLTDNGASWADAVARWTSSGWAVVTVDARGHGHAPRWDADDLASHPGDVMADDVVQLVADLGPVALVGHSMGAGVAVAAATQAPQGIWAVVAEDPPFTLPPRRRDAELARRYLDEHADDVATPRRSRIQQCRIDHPTWPASELEAWAEGDEQLDDGLLATGDIVPSTPWPELVGLLARSAVPLLVVTGSRDVLVDSSSEITARQHGAEVVRVAGAGHCVRRDAGAAYHAAVDAFLTRHHP